jgi:hypothetical protein
MLKLRTTAQFEKDYRKARKSGRDMARLKRVPGLRMSSNCPRSFGIINWWEPARAGGNAISRETGCSSTSLRKIPSSSSAQAPTPDFLRSRNRTSISCRSSGRERIGDTHTDRMEKSAVIRVHPCPPISCLAEKTSASMRSPKKGS